MADGDEDGGGVRTEHTKTRRQERAWCVVENTREPLLTHGRVYVRLGGVFIQGGSAPKGHWAVSGDICHYQDWKMLWVEARMLLDTLQGTRRPTTKTDVPQVNSAQGGKSWLGERAGEQCQLKYNVSHTQHLKFPVAMFKKEKEAGNMNFNAIFHFNPLSL